MAGMMMKCGCASNGVLRARGSETFDPPIPGCIIHECYEAADEAPSLDGRIAQCAYKPTGHAPKPSSPDLPFFEFRGEGSREAVETCACGND